MGINLLLKSLLYSFHDFPRRYYCPFNIVLLSETNLLLWDVKNHHNWQNCHTYLRTRIYLEEPSFYFLYSSLMFIISCLQKVIKQQFRVHLLFINPCFVHPVTFLILFTLPSELLCSALYISFRCWNHEWVELCWQFLHLPALQSCQGALVTELQC